MASVFKRGGSRAKGPWQISWFDHTGKRRSASSKTTDKAVAERIAAKNEADAALRREGVIDPTLDAISRESQRTIASHLVDYESKLRAAGRTEKHVHSTVSFINSIADFASFIECADISADGVNRYAESQKKAGRAPRTINAHLSAIKAFSKWLAEHDKLPRDPLASVKKPNPNSDRRIERRVLLPEEWPWLVSATQDGPIRCGMIGQERTLLYKLAIQTGLRSNELRSLTLASLHCSDVQPSVICRADSTKNGKEALLYINQQLASDLSTYMLTREQASASSLFDLPHESSLAKMLRSDLKAARELWLREKSSASDEQANGEGDDFLSPINSQGGRIDFHALRHTCGAWMAMTGANPKVVQSMMRHSTISLTMDTYGHLFPGEMADAAGRMGELLASNGHLSAFPSDTEEGEVGIRAQRIRQQSESVGVPVDAIDCEITAQQEERGKTTKSLPLIDLCDPMQDDASLVLSSGGGTRTPDTRIMIPLL
jgi:integrase